MTTIVLLVMTGVLLNTTAQILLKAGMIQIGQFEFAIENMVPIGLKVATNLPIISGLTCYGVSLILWLMVLSRVPVSIAYPLASLGYVINAFAAHYFLGEPLSAIRLLGVFIILGGVYLVAQNH
jgi:multidrug transporter EmrE-like cation transporter